MALIFFQRKLTIWIFQICKIWSPKWSPWATILYWLKKVQLQFCSNFEGIFGCRTSGAPKKAPFMYVEICPWVILFNSKLENEVLDDFQTYRLEKHGFFRFQGSPTRYGEFWGLQFGLQSPKNFIFINFRKNWKFFNFIMYAQNVPVLTCNPKFRNAIRFLTMSLISHNKNLNNSRVESWVGVNWMWRVEVGESGVEFQNCRVGVGSRLENF